MLFTKKPKDFTEKFEVISCFYEHNSEILLLKRQKYKPQGDTWGVPAGKIDSGEEPIEAVVREMFEETGLNLKIADITFFGKFYVKYPDLDFIYYIFHTKFGKKPSIKIKDKEHSEYIWISPQQALQMNLIEDLDACIKLYYGIK